LPGGASVYRCAGVISSAAPSRPSGRMIGRSVPLFFGLFEYGSKNIAELAPMIPSTQAL